MNFGRSLLDEGGVERLVSIARQKQRYSARVVKFASQVLAALWAHQELRDAYKKSGWKESDFVSRSGSAASAGGGGGSAGHGQGGQGGGPGGQGLSGVGHGQGGGASSPSHSAANSTLNRPMSSQGGTRYEDKTLSLQRQNQPHSNNGQAGRPQAGYRVPIPYQSNQFSPNLTYLRPTNTLPV